MVKLVFCNLRMIEEHIPFKYKKSDWGSGEVESKEVIFPINDVLSQTLNKEDDVKVILLKKKDPNNFSTKSAGIYMEELNAINKNIGAKITYKIIETPHNENRKYQEALFKDIVDELFDRAEIYADITYGTKSQPIILFYALNFAEKFFKCDIKRIIYGGVDRDANKQPINPEMFDMTSLFYLNALTNKIDCKDSKSAVKMLNIILS